MNSRVFVVNEPLRRDPVTGDIGQMMNFNPARVFGDLVFLLPAGELPADPSVLIRPLQAGLSTMTADDYLLPVGDLRAIAMASAMAADYLDGQLRLLIWQRELRRYVPVSVNVFEEGLTLCPDATGD